MSRPVHRMRSTTVGKFHRFDIGEPICVKFALVGSPADLRECLNELRSFRKERLFLVARLPGGIGRDGWMAMLDTATPLTLRVILVPPQAPALTLEPLTEIVTDHRWPCPLAVEPNPQRAVIGIMQSVAMDDTLAVLWPETGVAELLSLVVQAARWRATWEAPEDGEFHWLPPEPNGL
jgi:hypothetical protein